MKTSYLCLAVLVLLGPMLCIGAAESRPNIIWIVVEDQSRHYGCYGEPLVHTPRIDQLADGSVMLIDYKSSKSQLKNWAGERLREPQLPLYGVLTRKSVSAVSFAEVNVIDSGFKGLCLQQSPAAGILPTSQCRLDIPEQWPDLVSHWQQNLEQLVAQFLQGHCPVSPLDSNAYA